MPERGDRSFDRATARACAAPPAAWLCTSTPPFAGDIAARRPIAGATIARVHRDRSRCLSRYGSRYGRGLVDGAAGRDPCRTIGTIDAPRQRVGSLATAVGIRAARRRSFAKAGRRGAAAARSCCDRCRAGSVAVHRRRECSPHGRADSRRIGWPISIAHRARCGPGATNAAPASANGGGRADRLSARMARFRGVSTRHLGWRRLQARQASGPAPLAWLRSAHGCGTNSKRGQLQRAASGEAGRLSGGVARAG